MCKMNDLLSSIQVYQFCAIDLNLFLDNYPDNTNAKEDYCRVSAKLKELIGQYEKEYGPLTNFGSSYVENPEKWINTPWPWENMYKEDK